MLSLLQDQAYAVSGLLYTVFHLQDHQGTSKYFNSFELLFVQTNLNTRSQR